MTRDISLLPNYSMKLNTVKPQIFAKTCDHFCHEKLGNDKLTKLNYIKTQERCLPVA